MEAIHPANPSSTKAFVAQKTSPSWKLDTESKMFAIAVAISALVQVWGVVCWWNSSQA